MTACTLQLELNSHTVNLLINSAALTLVEPQEQIEVAFMGMTGLPGPTGALTPGAPALVFIGAAPPTPAEEGMLWRNSTNDLMSIYTSGQWVGQTVDGLNF